MDEQTRYACDIICNTVSAIEVGKLLGLAPGHDGRCKCPFHGGDHRNLKLYGPGRGYYCFVCHEHGNVIRLVREYTKCSFQESIEWLNDAFSLNLDLNKGNYWNRQRRAETYARKLGRENGNAPNPRRSV